VSASCKPFLWVRAQTLNGYARNQQRSPSEHSAGKSFSRIDVDLMMVFSPSRDNSQSKAFRYVSERTKNAPCTCIEHLAVECVASNDIRVFSYPALFERRLKLQKHPRIGIITGMRTAPMLTHKTYRLRQDVKSMTYRDACVCEQFTSCQLTRARGVRLRDRQTALLPPSFKVSENPVVQR